MIAEKVRILPGKTIRLNLATTKTFNADFDGDEMNVFMPASPETEAELRILSSVGNHVISVQSGKANIVIVQDSLLAAYLMTIRKEGITREDFFQLCMAFRDVPIEKILKKVEVYWEKSGKEEVYTGKMLFSMLLPDDFFYESHNKADPDDPKVVIEAGLLLKGAINKAQLGAGHSSLITILHKEYGVNRCLQFLDNVQFITNAYAQRYGFSVGIKDCLVTRHTEIQDTVAKSFLQAQNMENNIKNDFLRENYVIRSLGSARDLGMVIAKNAIDKENNFMKTIVSGAKGDYFNICQITGLVGQQDIEGSRVQKLLSNGTRTLYHYPMEITNQDMMYESRGFIRNSFIHGLNPREYWFHSMSGRIGIINTSMRVSTSGYVQRRMVKIAEDLQIKYDNTVRGVNGTIIQFAYGDISMDPKNCVILKEEVHVCNVARLAKRLNYQYERKQQ